MLRTAHDNHLPPTLYMPAWGKYGRVRPEWDELNQDWYYQPMSQQHRTPLDVRLELGYQFYLDALCPKCGVPWWYGRSTDSRVQFEVTQSTCYSCETLETFTDGLNRGKNPPKRHGVTDVVKPVGVYYEATGESEPLPSPYEAMKSA